VWSEVRAEHVGRRSRVAFEVLEEVGCFVEPELVIDRCDRELAVDEQAFGLEDVGIDELGPFGIGVAEG
jgi:hypothetical protein